MSHRRNKKMIKRFISISFCITFLMALPLLYGCGSGHKEGQPAQVQQPTKVGSESCVNTCHASTVDVSGTVISVAWANTTHNTVFGVQCEDCHGPASLHFGVGPIPFPVPQTAQCLVCHNGSRAADKSSFLQTAHANPNNIPDKTTQSSQHLPDLRRRPRFSGHGVHPRAADRRL